MRNYDDIINLPHPTSAKHPRMSIHDRAAQFSPFAALTGYGDAVNETARLTDKRIEIDDDAAEKLSERTRLLMDISEMEPEVSITYFVPDMKKDGGTYVTVNVKIKAIDTIAHVITATDGTKIPMKDIIAIDGEMFSDEDA